MNIYKKYSFKTYDKACMKQFLTKENILLTFFYFVDLFSFIRVVSPKDIVTSVALIMASVATKMSPVIQSREMKLTVGLFLFKKMD